MFLLIAALDAIPWWAWGAFFLFITATLAIDLGVLQRDAHVVKMREALSWCVVWSAFAAAFGGLVWWWRGSETGQQFLAAYLVELCLSIDNVFVFILIFAFFKVEPSFLTTFILLEITMAPSAAPPMAIISCGSASSTISILPPDST